MTNPPYPPPPYGAAQPPEPMSPSDEKMWAVLIQLGTLVFGFLSPLIGYLILKDRGPFVRAWSVTALNFQLTLLIAFVVGGLTVVFIVGIFILIAASIVGLVFTIIAAVKCGQGEWWEYPLTIRFIR